MAFRTAPATHHPARFGRISISFGRGRHLHRQTLRLRSVAGPGRRPCRASVPRRKGLRARLRSRTWTTVRIRRRAGWALRLDHLCQGGADALARH
jgi:hypothetical protein